MTVLQIDPSFYGPACAPLLSRQIFAPLGPGTPDPSVRGVLESLDVASVLGSHCVSDDEMAQCCRSALWLRFNYLGESHALSQGIATPSGSYWHGIMHRREPDYSNAKYWFRRVGEHPLFDTLAAAVAPLVGNALPELVSGSDVSGSGTSSPLWDPFLFVDLCAANAASKSEQEELCRRIADLEWQLLFDYCYRAAIGS